MEETLFSFIFLGAKTENNSCIACDPRWGVPSTDQTAPYTLLRYCHLWCNITMLTLILCHTTVYQPCTFARGFRHRVQITMCPLCSGIS